MADGGRYRRRRIANFAARAGVPGHVRGPHRPHFQAVVHNSAEWRGRALVRPDGGCGRRRRAAAGAARPRPRRGRCAQPRPGLVRRGAPVPHRGGGRRARLPDAGRRPPRRRGLRADRHDRPHQPGGRRDADHRRRGRRARPLHPARPARHRLHRGCAGDAWGDAGGAAGCRRGRPAGTCWSSPGSAASRSEGRRDVPSLHIKRKCVISFYNIGYASVRDACPADGRRAGPSPARIGRNTEDRHADRRQCAHPRAEQRRPLHRLRRRRQPRAAARGQGAGHRYPYPRGIRHRHQHDVLGHRLPRLAAGRRAAGAARPSSGRSRPISATTPPSRCGCTTSTTATRRA